MGPPPGHPKTVPTLYLYAGIWLRVPISHWPGTEPHGAAQGMDNYIPPP